MVQRGGPRDRSVAVLRVDPSDVRTKAEFATALSALTRGQVRGLADRSGVPRSTISGWTTGQNLPNPNQIDQLRRLLAAVDVEVSVREAWVDAVLRVRQAPTPRGGDPDRRSPYLGLEPFAETDADRFFGREDVVAALIDRVRSVRSARGVGHRFVLLIGASGEGKSSLLRAGAAVELAADRATTVSWLPTFSDGPPALEGLGPDHVVIVDQFEQVLGPGHNDLLDALVTASATAGGPTVVAAVRSDFYPRLIEVAALRESLVSHLVLLPPMTHEAMRRAVVEPARQAGVELEPGLVEMVLSDVAPATSLDDRPNAGVLPLLSHAMRETWARSAGGLLRVADYVSLGGLNGAIEKTAEVAFGRLDAFDAEAAGDLFRRLVNIADDGLITRRHAPLTEIADADDDTGLLTSVMWHFVNARLLTVDDSSVTLSHEVLLAAWPRLRTWIADDREGIRLHRELVAAAASWINDGDDDEGGLLAGGRIARARAWLDSPAGSRLAGPNERRLIEASEQRARRDASKARTRVRLITALAVVTVVAVVATVVARNRSVTQQRARIEAEVRGLANRSRGATDPYFAALYAIEATQQTDEPLIEARAAWFEATQRMGRQSVLRSGFDLELAIADLAFSPDGKVLGALGRDGTVHVIDPASRSELRRSEAGVGATAMAWSPDGHRLVIAGFDGMVRVLDAETLEPKGQSAAVETASATDVVWSPEGTTIAVTTGEGSLLLIDAETLVPVSEPISTGATEARRVDWHPDSNVVATTNFIGEVAFIDPLRHERVGNIVVAPGVVTNGLAWDPAGTTVAVTSSDGMVRFLDGRTATQLGPPISTGESYGLEVAWSPDGERVATTNEDGNLQVFTAAGHRPTGDPVATGSRAANGLAWSPDGGLIVTANDGGNLRFFDVVDEVTPSDFFGAHVALSPDATTIITTNFDDTIRSYDAETLEPTTAGVAAGGTDLTTIAWSHDGTTVAVGSATGGISLIDPSRAGSPVATHGGAGAAVTSITWTTDDAALMASDASGRVVLLNPVNLAVLEEIEIGTPVTSGSHSPEENVVALTAGDGMVHLVSIDPLAELSSPIPTGSAGANAVGWSSDGTKVATVNADGTVQIVDTSDRSIDATFDAPGTPQRVSWNPTGDVVAVGMDDGSVWLLAGEKLEKIGVLARSDARVIDLVWLSDGATLLSSHSSGTAVVNRAWSPSDGCAALRRILPDEEMEKLAGLADATSACIAGRVRDSTPLPATGGRTPSR